MTHDHELAERLADQEHRLARTAAGLREVLSVALEQLHERDRQLHRLREQHHQLRAAYRRRREHVLRDNRGRAV